MNDIILTVIELLKSGHPCSIGDIQLDTNKLGEITITGFSKYNNLKNITKEIALKELGETKSIYIGMVEVSNEMKIFTQGRPVIFNLNYDDAGKTSLLICSEKNGLIDWKI